MYRRYFLLVAVICGVWMSCSKDDNDPDMEVIPQIAPLNIDVNLMPYSTLSEYNLYTGSNMADLIPNEGLLLYEPITPLFTDYAKKTRYVWMPDSVSAHYESDFSTLNFPDGAVLIKNFYYENSLPTNERKVMETRMIFKRDGEWNFADYIWNEEQTEAFFSLEGATKPIQVVLETGETISFDYKVPTGTECFTCHKLGGTAIPNGPKPQNLNADLEYQEGIMNQLMKWADQGYLSADYPSEIETVVNWEDESQTLFDRVRAYLDANCAHCHADNTHCEYRPIRLDFANNDRPVNIGICEEFTEDFADSPPIDYIIEAGDADASMLIYRVSSVNTGYQMPFLGKSVVHKEGLQLLVDYVNSIPIECP
ncbi:MAG: hypothetical protein AAGC47_13735 [Bacteroidota bacterium]